MTHSMSFKRWFGRASRLSAILGRERVYQRTDGKFVDSPNCKIKKVNHQMEEGETNRSRQTSALSLVYTRFSRLDENEHFSIPSSITRSRVSDDSRGKSWSPRSSPSVYNILSGRGSECLKRKRTFFFFWRCWSLLSTNSGRPANRPPTVLKVV